MFPWVNKMIAITMTLCIAKAFAINDPMTHENNCHDTTSLQEQSWLCHKLCKTIAKHITASHESKCNGTAGCTRCNCKMLREIKLAIATVTAIKAVKCNALHADTIQVWQKLDNTPILSAHYIYFLSWKKWWHGPTQQTTDSVLLCSIVNVSNWRQAFK